MGKVFRFQYLLSIVFVLEAQVLSKFQAHSFSILYEMNLDFGNQTHESCIIGQ